MRLELEELAGGWAEIRELEERAEHVVDANVATPCVRNARSLLSCAVADAYADDPERSRRFEDRANELEMAGYRGTLAPLRIRLALARRDLGNLEELVQEAIPPPPAKNWWRLTTTAARLDALAALGDVGGVEAEAPRFLAGQTYLEPFALRALGQVRGDEKLLTRAATAFAAMGLDSFAGETRGLLGARTPQAR
jgi:hypothetical protein